jgi:hypothetical protein
VTGGTPLGEQAVIGLAPGEFWVASGHLLCDRDANGRVVATEALWRAFLARPELMPPEEACAAERALHARLLEAPLREVAATEIAAMADADARENWAVFLGFRERVAAEATLEAAYLRLYREGVAGIPPIFLQMLTHLVMRAALDGISDPQVLRAGELFFRPQRAAIHQGSLLLADEEVVERENRADGGFGTLGRLLAEAGTAPREIELDVLGEHNAHLYHGRSDGHDFCLDIVEGSAGQRAVGSAIERFVLHLLGERVRITPRRIIEDRDWTWHVGLDAEASAIANDLWAGKRVKQERLARILWLGVLEFEEASRVLPRVQGRPVYLALAMDVAKLVRMKPQNLVTGLPLLGLEGAS